MQKLKPDPDKLDYDLQMKARRKICAGDIFNFSVGDNGFAVGQVIISNILQYIIVFEPVFSEHVTVQEATKATPLLAGWTSDALIYHGHWKIAAQTDPVPFVFPEYKIGIEGQTWVTDVHGDCIRLATPSESENLRFRFSNSPIVFEQAFKAHQGMLPREEHVAEIYVESSTSTVN